MGVLFRNLKNELVTEMYGADIERYNNKSGYENITSVNVKERAEKLKQWQETQEKKPDRVSLSAAGQALAKTRKPRKSRRSTSSK